MLNFIDLSHVSLEDLKNNYLSNGYRFVHYDSKDSYLYALMFDKENKPFNFKYKYPAKLGYVVDKNTNTGLKDIYNRNIKYLEFKNTFERTKWINNNKEFANVVDAISPQQDFLTQLFFNEAELPEFNKQLLRIHFIDIETEISDTFEYPFTARNRINLITVYDNYLNTYFTWSLESISEKSIKLTNEDYVKNESKTEVFEFDNDETALLKHYIKWHSQNYPDIITGWNIRAYDIPYIIRRIENVLGKSFAQKLSILNRYYIKEDGDVENPNNPNSQKIEVKIVGIAQLDLLILYRDKFILKSALSGGYSLGNVGEAENLGDKLVFDGTLKDLYLKNWNLFYEYNVRDVHLTVKLEEKLKLIPLSRQLIGYGLIPDYERVYGSISYIVGSLYIFSKKHFNNLIFPTFIERDSDINIKFEGAYVFDTVPGIYYKGIASIDAASLYPSMIRSANISPETYIGKISGRSLNAENPEDEIVIQLRDGGVKKLTKKQFDKLLKERCIFTKNNTIFTKHSIKHGILPQWCEYYYKIRKEAKRASVKAHNKKQFELESELKARDLGLKLMLNSLYGITGSKFCPFFNPDISQTITRQGRFCNQSSEKYVREYFRERYNVANDYKAACGGDTDSFFSDSIIYVKEL